MILEGSGRAGCALEEGSLGPGDTLVMHYWGLAPMISGPYALQAWTRVSGGRGGVRHDLESPIEVVPGDAARLHLVAPSEVARGGVLTLVLVALDRFGNRAEGYTGTVRVALGGASRERTLEPEDRGIVELAGFRIERDGFFRAEVTEIDYPEAAYRLEARSNPIRVVEAGAARPVLWGDLHFHTGTGAGSGGDHRLTDAAGDHRGDYSSQVRAYAHARDVSRLDFASATEHAVEGYGAEAWARTRDAASRFHDPGVFTTFLGYHWRDRLVILPDDDGPLLSGDDRASDQPGELSRALREAGDGGAVLIALDSPPARGAVAGVEIYSWRNRSDGYVDSPARFEPDSGWLDMGGLDSLPASIIASSATHWGNPGTEDRTGLEPGAGGLTAVRARGRGREAILDALRSGDAWATTGARIYVALGLEEGGALRVVVAGERSLQEVSLVVVGRAGSTETTLLDEPADQIDRVIPLPSSDRPSFCFLRVRQVDGEMAWSSPVRLPDPQ